MAHRFVSSDRQQTYIGNNLNIDDISAGRKVTHAAHGKERIESTFNVKPVKTSKKVKDISGVKLPKGSVAVGEIGLGSKVIVEEPHEVIVYVDKPVEVEEIVYQPKITQQFIDKEVPVYYDEERIEDIEIDEIVYQEYETVEYVDTVCHTERLVPKTVHRKIPVTLTIPKIIENEVEKVIEVPSGEIIHKEVKIVKEKINHKVVFNEKPTPVIVSHIVTPIVSHDPNIIREVEVVDHYPVITPVDVHIAKPVNVNVRAIGGSEVTHKVVTVPAAHYNTMLKKLNPNLDESLPLFMENGVIPMLNQELSFLYPPADAEVVGFNAYDAAFSGIKEEDFVSSSRSKSATSSRTGTSISKHASRTMSMSTTSGSSSHDRTGSFASTYDANSRSTPVTRDTKVHSSQSSVVASKKKGFGRC